MQTQTLVNG